MANHPQSNGRNVALPDENRPSWRPQDEHQRNRRALSEEDDRYEDERSLRHWEDREHRDWDRDDWRGERLGQGRHPGYPGSFEERQRDRSSEDRFYGRGSSQYYERGYQPERLSTPRGYGYSDGDRDRDRSQYGTGGGISGSYPLHGARREPGSESFRSSSPTSGHRGKGPASYQRSDDRIREIICEALTEDDRIDATHIDVSVRNGEVTLSGTVDDRQMKRFAEDAVENISGVRDVQNQIRVGGREQGHRAAKSS